MESHLSHGFGCCCWCLESLFACRQRELRRDDTRSDPSHELLGIFSEVCRQGETSHTLPCFHPIKRKQKMILACISSSYLLFTMPCLCISKDLFTPSAILGNSIRNACWHFLTQSLGMVSSQQQRQEMPGRPPHSGDAMGRRAVCLNDYRRIHKRTDIPL